MKKYFKNYIKSLNSILNELLIEDESGNNIEPDSGFEILCEYSDKIRKSGATQYFCGNGASAAFANHMATDWTKNGKVITRSFSDSSLLTAIANDIGADELFSSALGFYAKAGDLLITISSSGNSPNILNAVKKARELSVDVVTLSGLSLDNASRKLGNINLYVPGKTYGMVECAHQILLHLWLDRYMKITEWDRNIIQNMRQDSYQL